MGYYMTQQGCSFFIARKRKPACLKAILGLVGKETLGDHYSWVAHFSQARSLAEAMHAWRWEVSEDEVGNIIDIVFEGQKLGDDEILFKTIAPFVRSGSWIEMHGDDCAMWRWKFKGKKCVVLHAKIGWGAHRKRESK